MRLERQIKGLIVGGNECQANELGIYSLRHMVLYLDCTVESPEEL